MAVLATTKSMDKSHFLLFQQAFWCIILAQLQYYCNIMHVQIFKIQINYWAGSVLAREPA